LLEPLFVTYAKEPFGDTVTALGVVPAATAAPTEVSAPVVALIV
jgi:hypothetical protein